MANDKKIQFIICGTDDRELEECKFYIHNLQIPENMQIEITEVFGAESMTAGYQAAMQASDAKYRIYLHQDTFIVYSYMLYDLLEIFQSNAKIGLVGVIGASELPVNEIPHKAWNLGRVDTNTSPFEFCYQKDRDIPKEGYWEAEAVDGLFMATQVDVAWREDLFSKFDFYDISMAMEMKRKGYMVVVPYQKKPWCWHDNETSKLVHYEQERQIFAKEYQDIKPFSIEEIYHFDKEQDALLEEFQAAVCCMIDENGVGQVEALLEQYHALIGSKSKLIQLENICYVRKMERAAGYKSGDLYGDGMKCTELLDSYVQDKFAVKRKTYGFVEEDEIVSSPFLKNIFCKKELPILILHGDSFCYNILNEIARILEHGLLALGQQVEMCDLSVDKRQKLGELSGKSYKGIIGIQNFITNIFLPGQNCYLTDLIHGPKLEMIFDHPFWFYEPLKHHGKDFYALTHDENYVKFIDKFGENVSGSYLLPPAGIVENIQEKERNLDVVFIGTYNDYREKLQGIYASHGQIRRLAARYLKYLRKNVNMPAETVFARTLEDFCMDINSENVPEWMFKMGDVCQCVMYYYREKIIRTLLDAKISLNVYGDSWQNSPFKDSPYLICHKGVMAQESKAILESAKISLNVLAWHKGGCNERILHSMLAGAVVVTDKSTYIEKKFSHEKELLYYDLENLEKLPEMILHLLEDENNRKKIAMEGRKKAEENYSSIEQAKKILRILEDINW